MHDLANAREHAPHPRGRERPRAGELDQQDLVHAAVPLLSRPSRQMPSGEEPGFVVVRAEIRRPRMRNVDGNQRDVRLAVLRGDGWGDGLVGLELDDQIDAVPNQELGVLDRDFRLVAVVHDDELDVFTLGGLDQAGMHLARERAVLSLRAVPDPVLLPAPRLRWSAGSDCSRPSR